MTGLKDEITTFILENWLQWQDCILAKLQQNSGLEGIEPENVMLNLNLNSKAKNCCRSIGFWMIPLWLNR